MAGQERRDLFLKRRIGTLHVFLANASSRVNTFGQLIGCALLLDNKIIATQISLLNPHITENIHIAYDFAYARFSPGLLLDRYVL